MGGCRECHQSYNIKMAVIAVEMPARAVKKSIMTIR
nr:MAG TPA: Cytochrome C' [Caudoviricetes sp.]